MKEQLKKYGKTAAVVLSSSSLANASIIYTDVVPDTTLSTDGSVYNVDLNNDAVNDFSVVFDSNGSSKSAGFQNPSGNSYISYNNRVRVLGSGVTVFNSAYSSNWGSNTNAAFNLGFLSYSYYGSYSNGPWQGGQLNKFVGVKFDVSGNTHFGWVRLSVPIGINSVTVHDYAYENLAGVPIITGQTITSVFNNIDVSECDSINLFGNTFTSSQTAYDTIVGGAASGGDSIIVANITIKNSTIVNIDTTIAQGSSIIIDGNTVTTAGNYSETFQNAEGCDSIINYNVSILQGIGKGILQNIDIYPNPTKDKITVNMDKQFSVITDIKVIDLQGKERVVIDDLSTRNKEVDVSNLDRGIYFLMVRLETGEYQVTRVTKI